MKYLYKPTFRFLTFDLIMLASWIFVILKWFPLTTNSPIDKYSIPSFIYILTWGLCSYLLGRYQPFRKQNYRYSQLLLFYTSLIVLTFFHVLILYCFAQKYSHNLLFTISAGEFSISYLTLTLYFSYRYAVEYVEDYSIFVIETNKNTPFESRILDQKSIENLYDNIRLITGNAGLNFLKINCDLESGNTFVNSSRSISNLKNIAHYQYTTIIQLIQLNNLRDINKLFAVANERLVQNGIFICYFESKSTYKKIKLGKLPLGANYLVYAFDFIFKRIFPKLFITRWFYFVFNGCKSRVLSKAEVLGRLTYCGFKIEHEKKVGQLNYIIARRIQQPSLYQFKSYGALIKLKRYGKNGIPFDVYKMRTMHPYSEYLQSYIFERNDLKEGGKFNKDIRITTLGKLMRKYWLDELPMIFNLLKGEMKLVGVRPLSPQYFNLYNKELQEKRIKFKPGLLPPFYADMPKTLDEIQNSEMKYLTLCEKSGVFQADMHYLVLILRNILLKKARSA